MAGRWARRIVLLVALLAAMGGGAVLIGLRAYDMPGPLAADAQVVVPRGAVATIGNALAEAGVVADPHAFALAASLTSRNGAVRAGEFAFPAQASLRQVLDILRTARPVQRRITIPEGLTAAQIVTLLDRAEGLVGSVEAPTEGTILPETYSFEFGATRASIIERARAAMDKAVAETWAGRAEGLPLATPRELVILASVVERETGKPEERARVAAVFVNRLRRGMPLQSDPTVAYAASEGTGALDRPISRADLDREHPFNTYRNAGLPPGPIASPGLASLRAAANPAQTEELYFVADGTGGHTFSRTLDEHNRAVARWRAIERERRSGG